MAAPQLYVLNTPLQVAKNLRYLDGNGDEVRTLYPNDYTSLIGSTTSSLIDQYNQIVTILAAYDARITILETKVTNILASGSTVPVVNAYCLYNDNVPHPITDSFQLLASAWCTYQTTAGTSTDWATAATTMCSNLGTLPAYSQNSVMSGLSGWINTPTTAAQSMKNLWLSYCDMRVGVTTALSQSNITCANIHIHYSSIYNPLSKIVTFYFNSSSIPSNFASGATTGTITITDSGNHTYVSTFNIVSAVNTGYVAFDLTNSPLSQTSVYTAIMQYTLTSTTPSLGCSGGVVGTVLNNLQQCPNTTVYSNSNTTVTFSFVPVVTTNVSYIVDLIQTSGTTSGGTVVATKNYVNPQTTTTDTFTGLTPSTRYEVRLSVVINGITTTCPLIIQSTSG